MVSYLCLSSNLYAEVSGKVIAYACEACHHHKFGLSSAELTQQLLNFKYQCSQTYIMDRITKGYSDSELKAVAEYIVSQP